MSIITELGKCPLCLQHLIVPQQTVSTEDYSFQTSDDVYNYVFCKECGLYFLENRPTPSELSKIYPSDYSGWNKRTRHMFWMRSKNFQSKFLNTLPPENANVLDFGCGNGEFLRSIEALTAKSIGFDFSIEQVPKNVRASSKTKFVTDIHSLSANAPFDRIFLLQSIEHLPDPLQTMIFLRDLLVVGGQIIIETPSRTGWDSKILPYKFWGGWHAPRHFHIWSKESIEKLSLKIDLRIKSAAYLPSPYQWAETLKPRVNRYFRPLITSENTIFVGIFYLLDLFQISVTGKSSNLRIILVRD